MIRVVTRQFRRE